MVRGLTAKQHAFASAVIGGASLADAYRAAYDCSRMKPATVRRKACELMKNGNIAAMVDDANREAAKAAEWSRKKALERLDAVNEAATHALTDGALEGGMRQSEVNAFLGTLDRLNAMCAVDAGGAGDVPRFYFDPGGDGRPAVILDDVAPDGVNGRKGVVCLGVKPKPLGGNDDEGKEAI